MKLTFSIAITFIICVSACRQPESTESKNTHFPEQTGFVNDFDNIFSVKEEKILDSLLKNFEARTSIEISVVTLDSSMTTLEDFNSYTLRLLKHWNIGKKDKCILIGISSSLQRVRISNSLGIEKSLSDLETRRVLDDFMFPKFRKGNFFEGTESGIKELVRILE